MDLHFSLWHNIPSRAQTALFLRFLDHTDTHTHPVGLLQTTDHPVAEVATYTTHNKHKRRISVPSPEFEPAIPAIDRLQTYALDGTAIGIGDLKNSVKNVDFNRLSQNSRRNGNLIFDYLQNCSLLKQNLLHRINYSVLRYIRWPASIRRNFGSDL